MVTLDTLANFRIQLHMFVYPQHIDTLLNRISDLLTTHTGSLDYDNSKKQITIRIADGSNIFNVREKISDIFADYLCSPEVENALKPNINELSFNDYKQITIFRNKFVFLYNTTVISISNIGETIIIQL